MSKDLTSDLASQENVYLKYCLVCNKDKLFGFTYIHNQAKTIFVCRECLIKSKKEKDYHEQN